MGILAASSPFTTESTIFLAVSGTSKVTSASLALRASTDSFSQLVGARGTSSTETFVTLPSGPNLRRLSDAGSLLFGYKTCSAGFRETAIFPAQSVARSDLLDKCNNTTSEKVSACQHGAFFPNASNFFGAQVPVILVFCPIGTARLGAFCRSPPSGEGAYGCPLKVT